MLYVILVNTCRVDQLIFTVQCELNKLQINFVKIFYFFCKKQQNRFVSRLTGGLERFFAGFSPVFAGKPIQIQIDLNWSNRSVFTDFYRFTVGKPLPVRGGFCIQNGFVNRAPCLVPERQQNAPPDREAACLLTRRDDRTRTGARRGKRLMNPEVRTRVEETCECDCDASDGTAARAKRNGYANQTSPSPPPTCPRNRKETKTIRGGTSGRQPGTFTCRRFMARLHPDSYAPVRPASASATASQSPHPLPLPRYYVPPTDPPSSCTVALERVPRVSKLQTLCVWSACPPLHRDNSLPFIREIKDGDSVSFVFFTSASTR
jgi:hypothetical protein